MRTRSDHRRKRFSLDDAAQLRNFIDQDEQALCPHCHQPMTAMVGRHGADAVWLLRCDACDRSIVLRQQTPAPQRLGIM